MSPYSDYSGALGWGEPLAGKGEVLGGKGLSLRIDLRVTRGTARILYWDGAPPVGWGGPMGLIGPGTRIVFFTIFFRFRVISHSI